MVVLYTALTYSDRALPGHGTSGVSSGWPHDSARYAPPSTHLTATLGAAVMISPTDETPHLAGRCPQSARRGGVGQY